MNNIPQVKIGLVAVSRDCFPASLAINRRKALIDSYKKLYNDVDVYECPGDTCMKHYTYENGDVVDQLTGEIIFH